MKIEWDENKNTQNFLKHGIRFEEIESILDRPMIFNIDDRYEYEEERWIGFGEKEGKVFQIVYTFRSDDTILRIISSRLATKKERNYYYESAQKNIL